MPRKPAENTSETVAERIAELMEARGWSRYRLASEAHIAESHLGNLLTGRTKRPRPETLAKLAEAFALTVPELLDRVPFSIEVVVPLTAHEHDVLNAAASFDRLQIDDLVRQALELFVDQQARLPRVRRVLAAIERGRQEQGNAVVTMADRSRGAKAP